ncbi:MAG: hypothetical protein QXK76_03340 [Candidatus Woesearchaeota archaeon]
MEELNNNLMEQQSTAEKSNELNQLATILSDLDRRIRLLEERYSNIRKKIQLTDQNIIESERSFVKEIKSVNDDALKIKKQVNDLTEKISILNDELNQSAKIKDIKILEKYLDLWNPKIFVTRKELKEYLEQKEIIEKTPIKKTIGKNNQTANTNTDENNTEDNDD